MSKTLLVLFNSTDVGSYFDKYKDEGVFFFVAADGTLNVKKKIDGKVELIAVYHKDKWIKCVFKEEDV